MAGAIPFRDRLTCTVKEAMQATGIGKTRMFELLASGEVQSMMDGGRRLVRVRSLIDRYDPAPAATATPASGRAAA